jgi:adenosine kinase
MFTMNQHNLLIARKVFPSTMERLTPHFQIHSYELDVIRPRDEFIALMRSGEVDLVFANEGELKALYETAEFSSALSALRSDVKRAAVTRSEHGAVIIEGDVTIPVPAVPIEQLVDATGAGDAYAAGFLFGYTRGMGFETAGQLGALAASHVIQKIGARPAEPLLGLAQQAGLLR